MSNPSLLKCMLGLFFCLFQFNWKVVAQNNNTKDTPVKSSMIVLRILPEKKVDTCARVIFQTSQRIYRVTVKSKIRKVNEIASTNILRLIDSKDKHIPVVVQRASEKSDLILTVEEEGKK